MTKVQYMTTPHSAVYEYILCDKVNGEHMIEHVPYYSCTLYRTATSPDVRIYMLRYNTKSTNEMNTACLCADAFELQAYIVDVKSVTTAYHNFHARWIS